MTFNCSYARSRAAAIAVLALSLAACGTDRPASQPGVASTTLLRPCSKCHDAPERGKLPRAELEPVLSRHRPRVHLDQGQWAAVLDYLAARSDATTPTQLDR